MWTLQSRRLTCRALSTAHYAGHCVMPHDRAHVSLSRVVYLQAANIEPFVQALAARVQTIPAFALPLCMPRNGDPQTSSGRWWQWLHNEEGTRSFVVWRTNASSSLRQLALCCDSALAAYHQPPFYHPPIFHVSLASMVPCVSNAVALAAAETVEINSDDEAASSPSDSSHTSSSDDDDSNLHTVTHIHCKVGGTKVYSISLQS